MALARWQATIMDESGEAQPSAQVTVTTEGGGLAQLYSDRDGLTPIGNPITADSEGFVFFHVTGGAYRIDATLGAFTRTWRYVGISTSSEHDFSEVGDPSELFFNAVEHGWLGDGNDHSVEALALLNTVNNAGGGTIYFPPSTSAYRADSQLLIPNNGATPQPVQKSIKFMGAGGGQNWYTLSAPQASILDLRYQGTGAKITSLGKGSLQLNNLLIKDGGSSIGGTPFVLVTNTCLTARDCTFQGLGDKTATVTITIATPGVVTWTGHLLRPGNIVVFTTTGALPTGLTAGTPYYVSPDGLTANSFRLRAIYGGSDINTTGSQSGTHTGIFAGLDAIVFGGTGGVDETVNSAFGGHGSVVDHCHFAILNRCVVGYNFANGIKVINCSSQANFGPWQLEFDSSHNQGVGGYIYGNYVAGNTFTVGAPFGSLDGLFGIRLVGCRDCYFCNEFHDPTAEFIAHYHLLNGQGASTGYSINNTIVAYENINQEELLAGDTISVAATTVVGARPQSAALTTNTAVRCRGQNEQLVKLAVTANTTVDLPAGYTLERIHVRNNTANAVTGGIKIGTTSGGTQVVTALAVGANAYADIAPTISGFSATATTLFIQAVTAWNSASVDIIISLRRGIP